MLNATIKKLCLILISLIILFYDLCAQNGAWTKKGSVSCTPRVGASACVINGKIYVIGGINADFLSLDVNEMYDQFTNKWEKRQPIPTARGFLATAAVNNIIYAFGGGNPSNPTNIVEAYDPALNTWTKKNNMLYSNCEIQAGVVDGIIYIIGGAYDRRYCMAYDPVTDQWSRKKDRPEIGGCIAHTIYKDLLYTFGGSKSPQGPVSPAVYAYDPKTDTWTKKRDMPTKRFGFQTFLVKDKIYAIGGTQSVPGTLSAVEVYDPAADSWEIKSNMPNQLAYFAGAVVNDKIYVISGTPDFATVAQDVWEYDPLFHTDIAAGNVSGIWSKEGSPYYINGEITIPKDSTLSVKPGVDIIFTGHYKFNVQGRLLALGTKTDSIRFTAQNKDKGWHSLRFDNTPNTNDTSRLYYCSFKYGKANTGSGFDRSGGAIMINQFDKVIVSDCLFDSNFQSGEGWNPVEASPAIYISNAKAIVKNSTFRNNTGSKGSAVGCINNSKAFILNNVLYNNTGRYGAIVSCFGGSSVISGNIVYDNNATEAAGGMLIDNGSAPSVENNIIYNNQGFIGGIACYLNAAPVIINNTITHNSGSTYCGGVYCGTNSSPVLINNIIYENLGPGGHQVYIDDAYSDPHFLFCDIQGGKEGFGGNGAGIYYSGRYENNIDKDPGFINSTPYFSEFSGSSPCIGAGIDSIQVSGKWYYAPKHCILGHPRPDPADSKPDLGACEHPSAIPTDIEKESSAPKAFSLSQNYPNPFNPATVIYYQLPTESHVTLKIYDILGNELTTLVNEYKTSGRYNVSWKAENFSSGVYFYIIKAGSFIQIKKMTLLR
ncbi:MAG: kelch repeat-containing protein [Bacillota bacterium]